MYISSTTVFVQQENLSTVVPPNIKTLPSYEEAFDRSSQSELMTTRSQMETAWAKLFPTVLPVPVSLNADCPNYEWSRNADSGDEQNEETIKKVESFGYLVPFVSNVKQHLGIKAVSEEVEINFKNNRVRAERPHQQELNETVYDDIWSGQRILNDTVFIESKGEVLVFQIYSDDVECGNPLGSAKGKHKLTFFFWTLMNLRPQYRSSLRSINLLGCAHSKLLKTYGVDKFLQPFLNDMEQFRNGITMTIRGKDRIWRGVIGNVVGDMLASNYLGGFKETASASSPCRICHISKADQDVIHSESLCILRTKDTHEQQLEEISDPDITQKYRNELKSKYRRRTYCQSRATL